MKEKPASIYGRGWAFPPTFMLDDPAGQDTGVLLADGLEDIRQSMQILFSTQPGERIMRPDYGCDLQPLVFSNITEDLTAEIKTRVTDGVLLHEQRVELDAVNVDQDESNSGLLRVHVIYRLRGSATAQRFSASLDIADGRDGGFL